MLAIVALLVTVFSTLLVIQADTAAAAPRRCFGWSGNTPLYPDGRIIGTTGR
jgi:hypothetical protein